MKKCITIVTLFLLLLALMTGCGEVILSPEAPSVTEPPAVSSQSNELALISITTVDQSEDAMDFVTEPVAAHVSSEIVKWTPGYVIPPEPYYEECTVTVYDGTGEVVLEQAEANVKVRGNWTTSYPKKGLRIKFSDAQTMLGLNGGAELKNWVLLAEYKDASMLRNKAAFAIADGILSPDGLYCADTRLVEVQVNGTYMGVYLLADYQQVNSDRVDITKPDDDYEGTDIGYFIEFDGYSYTNESELESFYISFADNAALTPYDGNGGSGRQMCATNNGFTIKSDVYSAQQRDFIASFVENVYRIMYSAAYNKEAYVFNADFTAIHKTDDLTPREAVELVVNVDSLADMFLVSEITCDADIYLTSFFMSADFGEGGDKRLTFEAPWDFDSAMGNKDRCADGKGYYACNIVPDVNGQFESINPWLAVLMYEDWFREIITEKWTVAYDSGVFSRTVEMIKTDAQQYAEAFENNYAKWNNIIDNGAFVNELSAQAAQCKTHSEAVQYLCRWLESRVEFLNDCWHS